MSLDWRRFKVAVDSEGMLLGCGQLKPHRGGIVELASIAVVPRHRREGIAGAIIEQLLAEAPRPVYLTCRSGLQAFYRTWGFISIPPAEMPAYFRRIWRMVDLANRLGMTPGNLSVMVLK